MSEINMENETHDFSDMNNDKLNEKMAKEESKLNTYKERRAKLDEKIRECEANIERLTLIKNSQRYKAFSNTVQKNGLTMDDILSALQSGDFLSLQEKIESDSPDAENQINGSEE